MGNRVFIPIVHLDDIQAKHPASQACMKIEVGDYTLSISMDNSCGAFPELVRSSVLIYKGEKDVTHEFADGDEINGLDSDLLYDLMTCLRFKSGYGKRTRK